MGWLPSPTIKLSQIALKVPLRQSYSLSSLSVLSENFNFLCFLGFLSLKTFEKSIVLYESPVNFMSVSVFKGF